MNFATRVLVVDDDPLARGYVSDLLEKVGVSSVREAENGREARKLINSECADLVFLDINMAQENGLEFLKKVRTGRTSAPRNLPVILMTGNREEKTIRAASALDCTAYLKKPASVKEVAQKILTAFRYQGAARPVIEYDRIALPDVDGMTTNTNLFSRFADWISDKPKKKPIHEEAAVYPPFHDYETVMPQDTKPASPKAVQDIQVSVHNLTPGDVLLDNIYSSSGMLVHTAGTRLTGMYIDNLINLTGHSGFWMVKVRRGQIRTRHRLG